MAVSLFVQLFSYGLFVQIQKGGGQNYSPRGRKVLAKGAIYARIYRPLREDFCPLPLYLYEKYLYEKSVRKIIVRKVLVRKVPVRKVRTKNNCTKSTARKQLYEK